MAAKKVVSNGMNGHDVIQLIALSDIWADHAWNARSVDFTLATSGLRPEEESTGLPGLAESIGLVGQDTAVVVRPTPKEAKRREPYMLVVGYRRFAAIQKLNENPNVEIPGLGKGTIKAVVRDLTEQGARALNMRENVDREDLSGADLAWGVYQLAKQGMSDTLIAKEFGKTQGYISTLHRIMAGVDPKITEDWRKHAKVQLSTTEMHSLLSPENKDRQAEVYQALVAGKTSEPAKRGPGAWVETAKKRAFALGEIVGRLKQSGFIRTFHVGQDDLDFCEVIGDMVKLKKDAKATDRKKVAKAAREGYLKGLEEQLGEPEEGEVEEEANA